MSCSSAWQRQCIGVVLGMMLHSAQRVSPLVQHDDDKCNSLRSTKNRFGEWLSSVDVSDGWDPSDSPWIKRAKCLSQALVHFVTARASLCTGHGMSGLSMRAKYKNSGRFESRLLTIPFPIRFLIRWSSRHGVETLHNCQTSLRFGGEEGGEGVTPTPN